MAERARRLGRPPATESADTRRRLLDVARERFADLGYQAATNKDIAEASGITTGAIYHYFGSKRELYEAVFDQVETIVSERYRAAVVDGDSFAANFQRILETGVELHAEDPSIAHFYVEVQTEAIRNEELAPLGQIQARNSVKIVAPLVEAGMAHGEFADGVVPRHVVYACLAMMSGVARMSVGLDDSSVLRQATSVLCELIGGDLLTTDGLGVN